MGRTCNLHGFAIVSRKSFNYYFGDVLRHELTLIVGTEFLVMGLYVLARTVRSPTVKSRSNLRGASLLAIYKMILRPKNSQAREKWLFLKDAYWYGHEVTFV